MQSNNLKTETLCQILVLKKLKNMNAEMNEMGMNTFVYFENESQENINVGTYGSTLLASDYSNRMVMPFEFIDSSTLK